MIGNIHRSWFSSAKLRNIQRHNAMDGDFFVADVGENIGLNREYFTE